MLKKWENAFIIISLMFLGLCGFVAQEAPSRNLDFLAEQLSAYFDRLLQRMDFSAGDTVSLIVENRIQQEEATRFVRDILIASLKRRGMSVLTAAVPSEVHPGHDRMEVAVESWQWQVKPTRNRNGTGQFLQSFTSSIRVLQIRPSGEVRQIFAEKIHARRVIKNREELYQVRLNQPAFAVSPVPIKAGKRKIIETILISFASAITIYLLFHIRSQ